MDERVKNLLRVCSCHPLMANLTHMFYLERQKKIFKRLKRKIKKKVLPLELSHCRSLKPKSRRITGTEQGTVRSWDNFVTSSSLG